MSCVRLRAFGPGGEPSKCPGPAYGCKPGQKLGGAYVEGRSACKALFGRARARPVNMRYLVRPDDNATDYSVETTIARNRSVRGDGWSVWLPIPRKERN